MDNDISAFSKGRMLYQCITRCTRLGNRSRMTQKTHNCLKESFSKCIIQNTCLWSVLCSCTYRSQSIMRMIDFRVVCLFTFPTLNVMGHGSYLMGHVSHIRWVSGSWVNSSDPLPALLHNTWPWMTLNGHFALNSVLRRYVWSSEAWLSKLGYS